MLYYFRVIAVSLYFLLFNAAIILVLLLRPFHADNTHRVLKLFKPAHWLVNLKVHCLKSQPEIGPVIYIANHQNLLDIFLFGQVWPKNNAVIGKQSLIWVPFFGIAYWLSGNLFINRGDKTKAWALVDQVAESIHQHQRSFLFMPEGTRSKGRGLLPFKKGAFAAAIKAGVPIVPLCGCSTTQVDLHQWKPSDLYVSYLDPIETTGLTEADADMLAEKCHQLMKNKIAELDAMMSTKKV